jgi:ABC toxin-like protein
MRVPRSEKRSTAGDGWAWMNRLRLWEANRKVFLYPENFLEPEPGSDTTSLTAGERTRRSNGGNSGDQKGLD